MAVQLIHFTPICKNRENLTDFEKNFLLSLRAKIFEMVNRGAFFLGILFFSLVSCGRDFKSEEQVNPLHSEQKKVVVHCVIHAQYPDWPLASNGNTDAFSEYSREPNIQRLFLCYNTLKNGKPEKLEKAVPTIYNETMDSPIGTFERVSDYEWQLRFLPTGTVIDDEHKLYSLKYRLDITGIPGIEKITSYAEVSRIIPMHYFVIDQENHVFSQSDAYEGTAWLFVNSYEQLFRGTTYLGINKLTPPTYLQTDYVNCDQFNYHGKNSGYQYAIRLQEYRKKDEAGRYTLVQKPYDDNTSYSGNVVSVPKSEATINYVSEDYDKFLKTGITYCVKNNLKPFSDEGLPGILPNSAIHSNIEGGIGVFGVQIVTFFTSTWSPSGSL